MNNNLENRVMNFTHPRHTSSESTRPLMHNFMPMSSSSAHVDHDLSESEKQASFKNQLKQNMQCFWRERLSDIYDADVRRRQRLPLARIKKAMKSDENVKMISRDMPVLLGKACEMFVMELSVRAWMHTQLNNRTTLQRNHVALASSHQHLLPFLSHIMSPQEEPHLPIPNHAEVYAPVPVMPANYLPNQCEEVAAVRGGPAGGNDIHHELGFGMNLQGNLNDGLFKRDGGMQVINPEFPPPSPSVDGTNPYLNFRDFFQ